MCSEVFCTSCLFTFFFFNDTATTEIYTLSLHDALPIWMGFGYLFPVAADVQIGKTFVFVHVDVAGRSRSEEHTSELQSQSNLVCRLLLEKKKSSIVAHCYHIMVTWLCTSMS